MQYDLDMIQFTTSDEPSVEATSTKDETETEDDERIQWKSVPNK